jgi:hypothetical protein
MALSKIDVANMLTGATPISNGGTGLTTNVSRSNAKSLIINGNMDVWQRTTSATATTGAYVTVDMYKISEDTDGSYTTERHTMSNAEKQTTGFNYALKAVCTGTDSSIGASQTAEITQKIEAQNCQVLQYGTSNAKSLTLAFWVKSSKTGTYCIAIRKRDSTSYDIPIEYTISSADTWEKKVIHISPTAGSTSLITSSGGAIANDTGEGIFVLFALAIGSNFHGTNNTWAASNKSSTSNQVNWMDSTDNNFYLTGVQLEVGEFDSTTIPPFQFESFDDNLKRCQRYFQAFHPRGSGKAFGSTTAYLQVPLLTTMRATPSYSQNAVFRITNNDTGEFTQSSAGGGFDQGDANSGRLAGNNFSSLTDAQTIHAAPNGNVSAHFSSEL